MSKKAKDFFSTFFIQGLDRRRRTCYNKLLSEQTRRTQPQRRSCVYPWSCDCKTLKSKRRCYKNGKVRNHADYQRRSRRGGYRRSGKFKSLIEANGTIDSIDEWGKRRLAYPINDEEEGVYTVINFTSEPSFPAELDRVYKITEGVMRSLIIAHEE